MSDPKFNVEIFGNFESNGFCIVLTEELQMNLGIKHFIRALVLGAPLIVFQSCYGKNDSQSIVDVRFDASYQQIASSEGDEWAPTWGRDDVLYTGSDDGTNFGGIPGSAVAFGKLVGNDPYNLRGATVNAMRDYREGEMWQTMNGYTIDGILYKFSPCDQVASLSDASCLTTSTGHGKRVFTSKQFREPSFISLSDNGETDALGAKAGDYVYAVANAGVIDGEPQYFIARVQKSKLSQGKSEDWSFQDKNASWAKNPDAAAPTLNSRFVDGQGANWKIMNCYSVDGVLYMFIARMDDYERSGEPEGRLIFRDSSIIKSTDSGKTWTRAAKENRTQPMFPGQRFGAPYFVWYGKDGAARVDNADQYVYAVSNNGYWESGDDYVLGRVLRRKLPDLSASDWSFYKRGRDEG